MDRRSFLKSTVSVAIAPCLTATGRTQDAYPESTKRPNIVFIMTDQQFADAMSCRMGSDHLHTPAMDRLAVRGMLFSRAYSPNPLCMPARNSIFTGRYAHETGVSKNAHPEGGRLAAEF